MLVSIRIEVLIRIKLSSVEMNWGKPGRVGGRI